MSKRVPSSAVVLAALAVGVIALVVGVALSRSTEVEERLPASSSPPLSQPPVESHKVSSTYWIVSKADKETYYSDLNSHSQDIALKPSDGPEEGSVSDIVIVRMSEKSPMYRAGFRVNDRILKVNGTPVTTKARVQNLLHEIKRSDDLTVQVKRGEEILDYRFEFR